MIKLENIAQQAFVDFAFKKRGMNLDWRYLSPDRKVEWAKDVVETFNLILDYVKADLKPYLQTGGIGSYEKGFAAGQAHEGRRTLEKVEQMKKQLEEQLENLKVKYANDKETV